MTTELVPSVQAALEIIPERKKDKFDRAMEVAHLFMDGTVGTVCGCINELFQTYALMQDSRERAKIVKYAYGYAETKAKAEIELRRLDILEQHQWQQYDLQKTTLTLYVDKHYQDAVDRITRSFHEEWNRTEQARYDFIKKIDEYTLTVTKGMDAQYRQILRQEEAICAAYRDVLHEMSAQGISRNQVASDMLNLTMANLDKLSDDNFKVLIDAITKMTEPVFISFEDYIRMKGELRIGRVN